MLGWDRRVESWIAGHRVSALDPVFRWLTYIGIDGIVWLVIAAVVALIARRWQVLVLVAIADLVAQLTTELLKLAIHRTRPRVTTLVPEPHSHSFPSGHAASSFACAVVLARVRAAVAGRVLRARRPDRVLTGLRRRPLPARRARGRRVGRRARPGASRSC